MKSNLLKNNGLFFLLCFFIWTQVIYLQHGSYRYFGVPLPSELKNMNIASEFNQKNVVAKAISELYKSLKDEKRPVERGNIFQNMGVSYYDLSQITRNMTFLDSAEAYYKQSIDIIPDNARFYYNLGRLNTERLNHGVAKDCYEKAAHLKPDYILALHNLALLNYFEMRDSREAKKLLLKVLSIEQNAPACNYVLGAIFEEERDYDKAIYHYTNEVTVFYNFIRGKTPIPVTRTTLEYALTHSHLKLVELYSSQQKNRDLARDNLDAYLKFEQAPGAREAAIKLFNKSWAQKYDSGK